MSEKEYFNFISPTDAYRGVVVVMDETGYDVVVHNYESVEDYRIEKRFDKIMKVVYYLKELGFYGNESRITIH